VSDITIKVECAVEGGSQGVLYDNAASPLPRLPASGRHDVIVTTDVKEQGQVELVASAVFTGGHGCVVIKLMITAYLDRLDFQHHLQCTLCTLCHFSS
jgi:hypothetical protein